MWGILIDADSQPIHFQSVLVLPIPFPWYQQSLPFPPLALFLPSYLLQSLIPPPDPPRPSPPTPPSFCQPISCKWA